MGVLSVVLATLLSAINIGMTLRTLWKDRQERRLPKPHPLDDPLRDIAAAIRDNRAALRLLERIDGPTPPPAR
jgi:hypothetical protein